MQTKWFRLKRQGKVVAACYIDHDERDHTYYIDGVQVNTRYRGRGLAVKVLRQAVKWADTRQLTLQLVAEPVESDSDGKRLITLYKKVGFKVKYRVHADAVVMQRKAQRR